MTSGLPESDPPQPPALATWLVRHLCTRDELEELQGDLNELYARNAQSRGRRHALRHYWRETFSLCLRRSRFVRRAPAMQSTQRLERVRVYWGRALITLGVIGLLSTATAIALVLGAPKHIAFAAGLLWLAPDPVYVLLQCCGVTSATTNTITCVDRVRTSARASRASSAGRVRVRGASASAFSIR